MSCNRIGLVAFCLFAGLCTVLPNAASGQDLFPDKGLEAAVRAEVFAKRYNQEPLTVEDVKNISQVIGKGKSIKSLEGLQHCVSVMLVDLENNEISDLAPLKDLKLIQSLTLAGNKIETLEPIAGLVKLQYLDVSRNAIKDLAPLSKMENMRSLYFSENQVESLAPIAPLVKIWSLYAAKNPLKDVAAISNLKWLSSLDLQGSNQSDLGFLKPLTELSYVMLADNNITDISVLLEMASGDSSGARRFSPFWRVYLYGNPLSEKATQEQLPALKNISAKVTVEKPQ